MDLLNIIQIMLVTSLIMLPLGYFLSRYLPRWWQRSRQSLLSPRYLKSEGVQLREAQPINKAAKNK